MWAPKGYTPKKQLKFLFIIMPKYVLKEEIVEDRNLRFDPPWFMLIIILILCWFDHIVIFHYSFPYSVLGIFCLTYVAVWN